MALEIDNQILIIITVDIRIDINIIVSKKKVEKITETVKNNKNEYIIAKRYPKILPLHR